LVSRSRQELASSAWALPKLAARHAAEQNASAKLTPDFIRMRIRLLSAAAARLIEAFC